MQYLLDTNIASALIKGNVPGVRRHLARIPMAQIGISAVTEGELRYGVAKCPEGHRLRPIVEEFLLRIEVLPWDSQAASSYGQLRASLERDGRPMGSLDTMIAAHAIAIGAVLVTHDKAFARIARLKVEDWTK